MTKNLVMYVVALRKGSDALSAMLHQIFRRNADATKLNVRPASPSSGISTGLSRIVLEPLIVASMLLLSDKLENNNVPITTTGNMIDIQKVDESHCHS